ncbi:MAG: hypothetical protein KJO07_17175, partial [Deltaproteobacteria bacterium]|nr:hypothetical protein [Deltaproteobacteria bacterium]
MSAGEDKANECVPFARELRGAPIARFFYDGQTGSTVVRDFADEPVDFEIGTDNSEWVEVNSNRGLFQAVRAAGGGAFRRFTGDEASSSKYSALDETSTMALEMVVDVDNTELNGAGTVLFGFSAPLQSGLSFGTFQERIRLTSGQTGQSLINAEWPLGPLRDADRAVVHVVMNYNTDLAIENRYIFYINCVRVERIDQMLFDIPLVVVAKDDYTISLGNYDPYDAFEPTTDPQSSIEGTIYYAAIYNGLTTSVMDHNCDVLGQSDSAPDLGE